MFSVTIPHKWTRPTDCWMDIFKEGFLNILAGILSDKVIGGYWVKFCERFMLVFSKTHFSNPIQKSDTNSWNFSRVGMKIICCPPAKKCLYWILILVFDFGFRKWFLKMVFENEM